MGPITHPYCRVVQSNAAKLTEPIFLFSWNMLLAIFLWYILVVYDRNQVLVSGTETKVQFWYRCRSRIFFFWNRNFLFQIFLMFPHFFLGDMSLKIKLENKPRSSKIIWKYLRFGSKFGFKALLWWKKYPILLVTRFSLWNVVLASVAVSAKSICQLGFWSYPNGI